MLVNTIFNVDEKLLIFSAPSGAGKTTIVRHLLSKYSQLEFSVSACSRAPRGGEIDGKDYHFLTPDEFRQKIGNDEFDEWDEVYPGHYYGTLWSELRRIWAKGNVVMFDVDVKGGINLKKKFPNSSISVFVMPPSVEELRQRLVNRGTETAEKIEMRVSKAQHEIEFADQFDVVIVNDKLDDALAMAEKTVQQLLNDR